MQLLRSMTKTRGYELEKLVYTHPYASGHYIELIGSSVDDAVKAIQSGIKISAFTSHFPEAKIDSNVIIVQSGSDFFLNEYWFDFHVPFTRLKIKMTEKDFEKQINLENWKYTESEVYGETKQSRLTAFYFPQPLHTDALASTALKMVRWVDSILDTSVYVIYNDANCELFPILDSTSNVLKFLDYVNQNVKPQVVISEMTSPEDPEDVIGNYCRYIDSNLAKLNTFHKLLDSAVAEALSGGNSTWEFEEYVAKYHSIGTALELKRKRVTMGTCGGSVGVQVFHKQQIAQLAAEVGDLDLFIRAHFELLMADCWRLAYSYTFRDYRGAYVDELEILGIDVVDLLIATCLEARDLPENHLFTTPDIAARALVDVRDSEKTENRLVELIQDPYIDLPNRIVVADILWHYCYFAKDAEIKERAKSKLLIAVEHLPMYIQKKCLKLTD